PLFRDALQRAVLAALPQAQVRSAESVHGLYALIEQYPDADLLLLDLHMPGARGYSALVHIRGQYPGLPIIVVSGHEEAQVARRALAHGAARVAALTPQQFRVLTMIAEGLLNKQIAWELGVSEATVKAHMTAIMRKLGVNNRTQVALAASQLAVEPG